MGVAPITLTLEPHKGLSPLPISIIVHLTPDPRNRILCLGWGMDEWTNLSCQDLEGELAPKVYQFSRRLDEPGEWQIVAKVQRNDGSSSISEEEVEVQ